ncbi:MAG: alpha-amylase family glycosyl hydrolase [Nannocystales bacterium]
MSALVRGLRDSALAAVVLLSGCEPSTAEQAADADVDTDTLADLEHAEHIRSQQLRVSPETRAWSRRVLYFAVLDRFANGDPSIDVAHGDADCNNANDAHAYQGGDLQGLRGRLDHIQALGADALWITPLYRGVEQRQGANCGFPGYWADFTDPYTLDLDSRFGDAEDFDELLLDAHERGFRVMLDMVINHAGYDAHIVEQHPGWFATDATCQSGDPDIDCSLAGLPDFIHANPEVRAYLIDLHQQWVDRFDVDAIRMDTVKHVRPEVFAEWLDAMHSVRPDLFMVGELLDEHSHDRFGPYLDAGFDGLFNFPLRRGLIETFAWGHSTNAIADRMQHTLAYFGAEGVSRQVNLLDNHDVPRFLSEIPGHVPGPEAQQRYALAMTALLTMPGIPQIYYGNEVGMYGGGDPDNRRFMPEWAFSEDGRSQPHSGFLPDPGGVYEHVRRLLSIRRSHRALQDGSYHELWRQGAPQNNNVWSYARVGPDGGPPVVVGFNNGGLPTDGAVPLNVGAWFEDGDTLVDALGGGSSYTVQGDTLWLSLAARSSVVLVPADTPDPDDHVEIEFDVDADTWFGQNIFVTGSSPALGSWDLNDAVPMTPSDCQGTRCRWSATIAVPPNSTHEYKFTKIDDGLDVVWETGFNRELVATEDLNLVTAEFRL